MIYNMLFMFILAIKKFYIFQTFLEPLLNPEGDEHLLKSGQAVDICTNFEQLMTEHEEYNSSFLFFKLVSFLLETEERLKEWEDVGTLTDLFENRVLF